jgi:ribosome-associated protein
MVYMDIDAFEKISEDLKKRKIPQAVKKVVLAMLDKKAENIVVLKLKELSDVTDYMIICHGNSARQNQAISDEIQRRLKKELKLKTFSVEGKVRAEWILLDYIDMIVHIFLPESRQKFALEKLWMDAKRYNFYSD